MSDHRGLGHETNFHDAKGPGWMYFAVAALCAVAVLTSHPNLLHWF